MGRVRHSFRILRVSLAVLSRDRELLLMPIFSFAGIAVAVWGVATLSMQLGEGTLILAMYLLIPFAGSFVALFCNATVVAAASIRLAGGDPTLRDGLRVARAHARPLARWALYSVTIGALVRSLGRFGGTFGAMAADLAWAAATYFVVPIIVLEDQPHRVALRRSADLCRRRFGDSVVAASTVTIALLVIAVPISLLLLAFEPVSVTFSFWALIVLMTVATLVGSTLGGIFQAAMYRYALDGTISDFSAEDLVGTFRRG